MDCANGAASATAPELFGRFKAHTVFLHRTSDGVNINDRCGSTHLENLAAQVVREGYDVGVAFDGDADRCLLVDEADGVIDGEGHGRLRPGHEAPGHPPGKRRGGGGDE